MKSLSLWVSSPSPSSQTFFFPSVFPFLSPMNSQISRPPSANLSLVTFVRLVHLFFDLGDRGYYAPVMFFLSAGIRLLVCLLFVSLHL